MMATIAVQATPSSRDIQFQPVQGGADTTSGSTLLVEAYAAIWIILLGFLLLGWRRQSRLEAKVKELERAVAKVTKTKEEAK